MGKSHILAIDLGTTNCKTLIIDEDLHISAKDMQEYPVSIIKSGWSEQDPTHWWSALRASIRKLTDKVGGHNIKAIGLSGQMHGLVALDKKQRVLRPAILWNDQRSKNECEYIYEKTGGIEGLMLHTNNSMLPGYVGGKLLWMKEHEPDFFNAIDRVVLPKDYLRLKLIGEVGTDYSDASGTGLFDVRERRWAGRLLSLLDLPTEWFPPCHGSGEIAGTLIREVAQDLNLPTGTPVVYGGGDAVMQTVGAGSLDHKTVLVVIGTGGNVTVSFPQCPDNSNGGFQVFCHVLTGKWVALGVTVTAGSSLKWFRDNLADIEVARAREAGTDPYEILSEIAALSPAGSNGLIFLPYLQGERCPHTDPDARGCIFGLSLASSKSDIVRSIMEGVAFSLRDVLELIARSGISPKQIRISGGGASSPLWRQILADVFNVEVDTRDYSEDASAIGAGIVAGIAIGFWTTIEAALAKIKHKTADRPIKKNAALYANKFKLYKSLYPALADRFKEIAP